MIRAIPRESDESTDTYDTVEWLLQNVRGNNGRVGVLGVSYPGFLATMAGINPHPAVKADLAPGADDRHLDGRRLLSSGRVPAVVRLRVRRLMELSTDSPLSGDLGIASWDTYDWYARAGPARQRGRECTFTERCPPGRPSWPIRRTTVSGRQRAVQRILKAPPVPTLTVGGWWDQEDRYGPLATYRALERGDVAGRTFW